MADLIDREYAKEAVKYIPWCDWKAVGECLDACPAIDPENLRPKGEWKLLHTGEILEFVWECSNCKHKMGVPFKFCPNCGAYMRGEGE